MKIGGIIWNSSECIINLVVQYHVFVVDIFHGNAAFFAERHRPVTVKGAARVYQRHDFADEKREAMDKWGAFLTGLLSPQNNVIKLAEVAA